jgi:hypothetical protein
VIPLGKATSWRPWRYQRFSGLPAWRRKAVSSSEVGFPSSRQITKTASLSVRRLERFR